MAYEKPKDYVEVSERLVEFREKHPDGCLQTLECELIVNEAARGWFVKVAAFRTPDDPRPAIATAFEPVPGKTPYTKDSELMNAETSAWGRALIALGAADAKRGIASANEVRNRRAPDVQTSPPPPADPILEAAKKTMTGPEFVEWLRANYDLAARDLAAAPEDVRASILAALTNLSKENR